ncbi:dihydrofolate reductase [Hwanghaeella sp.]|uniref:dihydrofolate reductase n=1 Tax=Hwanghaeella sp. TaxID=2605943 RepID=UPI003CCC44F9
MPKLVIVVAMAENRVIGRDGGLPWHLPEDLKRFKAVTMGKPLVMGRKTWESLPRKPLPGRPNLVVTRQKGFEAEGALVFAELDAALAEADRLAQASGVDEVCLIGGGSLYEQAFEKVDRIDLTEVRLAPEGDTHFPELDPTSWREVSRDTATAADGTEFDHVILERV